MNRMVKIRLVFLVSGMLIAATSSPGVLAIGQKAYVDFAQARTASAWRRATDWRCFVSMRTTIQVWCAP
jgi:hypothetical protein